MEKSGEVLFSTHISFYTEVECLYHNNCVLFHTLLWPFLNRGRGNLDVMSWKANFYQCLQIRHFTIFYGELVQNIVSFKNGPMEAYFLT